MALIFRIWCRRWCCLILICRLLLVSASRLPDGRMEIVIGADRRVIVNADVDGPALARVLKVLGRR